MHCRAAFAVGVTCLLGFTTLVDARPQFRQRIPNGTVIPPGATRDCQNCHVNEGGGAPWNDFGDQIRSQGAGGPNWEDLYFLDADGDGQTNGQELGDPCGTWVVAEVPPRTVGLGAAGDDMVQASDPDTPACDDPDAGMPDTGMAPVDGGLMDAGVGPVDSGVADPNIVDADIEGGCTCVPRQTSAPVLGLLLGALALYARRRLRRVAVPVASRRRAGSRNA